jgi:ribonucleoside-diphosphate reductase alpha chain
MPFDSPLAEDIYKKRYRHPNDRDWNGTAWRVTDAVMSALTMPGLSEHKHRIFNLIASKQAIPGGRYLYASGRDFHQVNNCVLLRCPDTREGWATTSYQSEMALMTGAGIGSWYGDVRPSGSIIRRTGGVASGPIPKMQQVNETGRHTMQGGNRRSAIWAGLPWWHPDIFDFITVKDWSDEIRAMKAKDWTFPAPMDMTNISVTLDDSFFTAYQNEPFWEQVTHGSSACSAPDGGSWHAWAHRVYDTAVAHMLKHGEPGFSIDTGDNAGEVLRNACTEITSADDSDVCNLGSLVLSRFSTPEQFGSAVRDMVLFLTAGTEYSLVPYDKVAEVREKNRRLGLGLIGVHEFLMKRGVKYGTDDAFEVLEPYMEQYARALEHAHDWQSQLDLSLSKGATAIAPNGTIGIIAESTPSADPIFSAAEIRNVKVAGPKGDTFEQHVVVDPTARRLVAEGVDPAMIEDAATLALYPERRLAQQAYLQRYVDHAISSTVNLPAVVTDPREAAEFGSTLMSYLPELRGITVYPDGARAGQPRNPVDLEWALQNEGVREAVTEETCIGGVCGL